MLFLINNVISMAVCRNIPRYAALTKCTSIVIGIERPVGTLTAFPSVGSACGQIIQGQRIRYELTTLYRKTSVKKVYFKFLFLMIITILICIKLRCFRYANVLYKSRFF